jgi:pyrroline-5-carboxylate reductase
VKLDAPLLLVGCGKMGGALLDGWLKRGVAAKDVVVVEPAVATGGASVPAGITPLGSADAIPAGFAPGLVLIAVKPQSMAEVLPAYRRFATKATFVSIAAGKTIASFTAVLGAETPVIRVMPNTPAAISRGISVLCANKAASERTRALATELMAAVGETAWIADEAMMDAVTAVSGSGPAYVFLLIETLAAAGVAQGLPADLALQLARTTVEGAGALAVQSTDPPAQLRQNVTSPGGTTAAALSVLMAAEGLAPLMAKAVAAATARGRELAG